MKELDDKTLELLGLLANSPESLEKYQGNVMFKSRTEKWHIQQSAYAIQMLEKIIKECQDNAVHHRKKTGSIKSSD